MMNDNGTKASSEFHDIEDDSNESLHHPLLSLDVAKLGLTTMNTQLDSELVANNNNDNTASILKLQMAAMLVEQVILGRSMPMEIIQHKNYKEAKLAFLLYQRLWSARATSFVILVMLPIFEVPSWCKGERPQPCGDPQTYALSGISYMKNWHSLLIQAICLIFLVFSTTLQWYFLGEKFWNRHVSIYKVGLLAIMIVFVTVSAAGMHVPEAVQLSMYIRFIIPIIFTRPLRMCFRMTAHIVHTFVNIAVLMVIFVLLSAYFATLVFGETTSEFEDYSTALVNLVVLLTTANNPNVWAPAYTADRRAFFFFFTFLLVGLFFLTNFAFTVIYSSYKAQIAHEVVKWSTMQQKTLSVAFTLLDTSNQNYINGAHMMILFDTIDLYRDIPDFQLHLRQVFLALGKNEDSAIHKDEFEALCDVIVLQIEQQFQSLPKSQGPFREMVNQFWWLKFSSQPSYSHFIWAATFLSLLLAICEREAKDNVLKNNLVIMVFIFGWVFLLDAFFKIVLQSWNVYWSHSLNRFDFVFSLLILVIFFASTVFGIQPRWMSILLIARAFRVLHLVTLMSHWRLMARTLVKLIPATAPILALQFLICSFFSLLGVHLFGGEVYIGHPALENTEYANGRLFAFNYNDYASAVVTSFNLCVVNNWYVIMDAYAIVTQTAWSRSFFILFWGIAVVFTLNVVVAFFVEAFVKEMELAESLHISHRSSDPSKRRLVSQRKLSYHNLYKDICKNSDPTNENLSLDLV